MRVLTLVAWFIMHASHPPNASAVSTFQPDTPPQASTPAYAASQAEHTWGTIAGTGSRISDLDLPTGGNTGITAITDTWNSMAVDQSIGMGVYSCSGGHLDRPYNDRFAIDFTADAPAWIMQRATSSITGGSSGFNSLANFDDGQPRAVHTYNHICAGGGSVFHTGMDAHYSAVGYTSCVYYSAPLTQDADYTYRGNPLPAGHNEGQGLNWLGGGSAYDETTGLVWATAQYGAGDRVVSFNPANGDFALFNVPSSNVGYNWVCIADELRLILIGGVNGLWYAHLVNDFSGSTITWHSVTRSGTPSITGQGQNAVYHHASRALFSHNGDGANIRKCTIPATLTDTWVQSSVSPAAGNQVTPSAPPVNGSGTFGRFNIVRDLGGVDIFVLHQGIDEPVYFMPIPVGGL